MDAPPYRKAVRYKAVLTADASSNVSSEGHIYIIRILIRLEQLLMNER
jgi:hypothetical protein